MEPIKNIQENFPSIKSNEILLESVMENLFDGIVISDNEGKVILHNSKFREIWNVPEEIVSEIDQEGILQYALGQAVNAEELFKRITRVWKEDSKDFGLVNLVDGRIIEYFMTPLIQNEMKYGNVGIFRDITEKTRLLIKLEEYTINLEKVVKQRTEQINNLNKQLQEEIEKSKLAERMVKAALKTEKEVSQLKSSFISSASHEFKTPLTTILSSTDLMETFWQNGNYNKFIEHKDKIKTKAHAIIKLIDDVLVVHQIEKNVMKINTEKIDLKEVVEELLDEVKVIDMQNHDLVYNFYGNNTVVESDPKIFRHVIGNLLVNAVKYTPGGGKILLEVNSGTDNVKIMVADEGPGIPAESIGKIFEPFERDESVRDKEGAGLGLSIVKYTLDLCGGKIDVVSKKDKGTSFFVTIPLDRK